MEPRFDIMLILGSSVAPRSVALSVVLIMFPASVSVGFCFICALNWISWVFVLLSLMNHFWHHASKVFICRCNILWR